jgi:hypothetical protein
MPPALPEGTQTEANGGRMTPERPITTLEDLRRYEDAAVVAIMEALIALTVERPANDVSKARPWRYVSSSELAFVAELTWQETAEAVRRAFKRGYIIERPSPLGGGWEYRVDPRLVP